MSPEREIKIRYNRLRSAWDFSDKVVHARFSCREAIDREEQSALDSLLNRASIANTNEPAPPTPHILDAVTPPRSLTAIPEPGERHHAELRPFQVKASGEILERILVHEAYGVQLYADTGTGKTYIVASVIERLRSSGWFNGRTLSHMPAMWVTRAAVVEQTKRVCKEGFELRPEDITITGYDQLRTKRFQEELMTCETVIKDGEPEIIWRPKALFTPALIVWDESHSLKNITSTRAKIAIAFNYTPRPVVQICLSATPWTRMIDAYHLIGAIRRSI